jgi:hypothetical protein
MTSMAWCDFVMRIEEARVKAEKAFIEENGHTCVVLRDTRPSQIDWCQRVSCIGRAELERVRSSDRERDRAPSPVNHECTKCETAADDDAPPRPTTTRRRAPERAATSRK